MFQKIFEDVFKSPRKLVALLISMTGMPFKSSDDFMVFLIMNFLIMARGMMLLSVLQKEIRNELKDGLLYMLGVEPHAYYIAHILTVLFQSVGFIFCIPWFLYLFNYFPQPVQHYVKEPGDLYNVAYRDRVGIDPPGCVRGS